MMIQTEHLSKTYQNGFEAVKDLNLHVNNGDIFGFLGPNGAGKTTTIRMLDGLLTPTTGKVVINGMDIQKQPIEIKKIIGVVPESHGYYDWMTAAEYLQYFSTLFDGNKANSHYIGELLNKVGLQEKRNVPVGHFSRGMKQRLGIAKALVNHPKVVFLDEPTLGLDPRGQKEIQQLILDINKMNGVTVFITSHLLKDVEVLCSTVCIIKDGSIAVQGSIQQLQEKYMPGYEMLLQTSDNMAAMSLLLDIKDIGKVTTAGDYITVEFPSGLSADEVNSLIHRLVAAIITANIDIKEMTRKTLSMEDIFFQATEVHRNGPEAEQ